MAEDGAPLLPPEPAEELFAKAEDARRRQVWEEAIRLYRFALQKSPDHMDARYGLASAYQGKSHEPGYESYLESAMGEYRKIIAKDPAQAKAHDGLLAAAAKTGGLDDMLDQYKARIAQGGDVKPFQDALRKIQALLILQTTPHKAEAAPPPGWVSFLFGIVAPGLALLALLASLILRLKSGDSAVMPLVSRGLVKLSMTSFMAFACYKVFVYWRLSR